MSYKGYYICELDGEITVETAPGCILGFSSIREARQFIDSICGYNEAG